MKRALALAFVLIFGTGAGTGEPWACSLDDLDDTLTLCQPAKPGLRLYLTDVVIQSTTGDPGLFLLRYGTGTDCADGTTSFFPAVPGVSASRRIEYSENVFAPTVIALNVPIAVARNADICVICDAVTPEESTNTCTVQLTGFAAP